MESPLAASPFPPLGSNQVSALGNLATSTTLDVPFPSLLPSLRVDPESTPALFTRPSSYGSRRVGERKGDGEYSKSPGAARHDGRDRVEIGLGHLFGFINRSLLHHLVNTNTTPKDSAFSSHLVDGLGCRAELDLADRLPPSARKSELPNDSSFPMGRFGRLTTRPSHLAVSTPFSRPNSSKLQVCVVPGQSVSSGAVLSVGTDRSKLSNQCTTQPSEPRPVWTSPFLMAATRQDAGLTSLHNGHAWSWASSQCELLQLGSLPACLQFCSDLESRLFSRREYRTGVLYCTAQSTQEISPKLTEQMADNTIAFTTCRCGLWFMVSGCLHCQSKQTCHVLI